MRFALAGALAACGGDSATNATLVVGDTYTLKTINGVTLPVVTQVTGNSTFEVMDEFYALKANSTYSEGGHVRTTVGAGGSVTVNSYVDQGTYSITGDVIALTSDVTKKVLTGKISNGVFTLIIGTNTYVYQR